MLKWMTTIYHQIYQEKVKSALHGNMLKIFSFSDSVSLEGFPRSQKFYSLLTTQYLMKVFVGDFILKQISLFCEIRCKIRIYYCMFYQLWYISYYLYRFISILSFIRQWHFQYLCILVNGTAQSAQPITSIANQSAAAVAACAAAAATGCPGTPSPVTHTTEPLSATAAAVFAATGIHPAAYAGGKKFINIHIWWYI